MATLIRLARPADADDIVRLTNQLGYDMRQVEDWARERGCFIIRLTSSSTRTGAHRFYEQLGYENIKMQYAFAKALDGAAEMNVKRFVPRVD